MPSIGLAIPGLKNLSELAFNTGPQVFGIGNFLVALITFIIMAFVIFLLVKITKNWGIK